MTSKVIEFLTAKGEAFEPNADETGEVTSLAIGTYYTVVPEDHNASPNAHIVSEKILRVVAFSGPNVLVSPTKSGVVVLNAADYKWFNATSMYQAFKALGVKSLPEGGPITEAKA